jgi:predicted small secreted protein
MKTYRPIVVVLLAVAFQALFAGCANTARGVKQDTNNAAEHVENATR